MTLSGMTLSSGSTQAGLASSGSSHPLAPSPAPASSTPFLRKEQIYLYILQKESYAQQMRQVFQGQLVGPTDPVCILSFARPYVSLKDDVCGLSPVGNTAPVRFIDVLTQQSGSPPAATDCVFVQSANALTDISLEISDALSSGVGTLIIDSICFLGLYEDSVAAMKFIQMLITKIRVAGKKGVFIGVKDPASSCLSDLMMFVDVFVTL